MCERGEGERCGVRMRVCARESVRVREKVFASE